MRILLSVTVAASALVPLTKRLGTPGRIVAVRSAYDIEGGDTSSAPYDIEEPAPTEPTKDVAALKSKLFAACAAADRGFAASPADRAEIEALLDELSPLSPTDEPTRGLAEGAADAPLRKCWRLVYTSASDVSTLAANPLASLGGIYQDARELPVVVNVIDSFPRCVPASPRLRGPLTSPTTHPCERISPDAGCWRTSPRTPPRSSRRRRGCASRREPDHARRRASGSALNASAPSSWRSSARRCPTGYQNQRWTCRKLG